MKFSSTRGKGNSQVHYSLELRAFVGRGFVPQGAASLRSAIVQVCMGGWPCPLLSYKPAGQSLHHSHRHKVASWDLPLTAGAVLKPHTPLATSGKESCSASMHSCARLSPSRIKVLQFPDQPFCRRFAHKATAAALRRCALSLHPGSCHRIVEPC